MKSNFHRIGYEIHVIFSHLLVIFPMSMNPVLPYCCDYNQTEVTQNKGIEDIVDICFICVCGEDSALRGIRMSLFNFLLFH